VQNLQTSSSDTEQVSAFQRAAADARAAGEAPAEVLRGAASSRYEQVAGNARQGNRPAKQETVVKDEWSKTPRNAPCPCGSGKKFKMCHGAS
jgi:preprotein translocase subunit SecA